MQRIGLAVVGIEQSLRCVVAQADADAGEAIASLLGGLVVAGTVVRDPQSLAVTFMISDLKKQVPVTYTGILPDLFKEGQGIVSNGYFKNGQVEAEEVLAKHDENYMPPQVKQAIDEAGHPSKK